MTRTAGLPRSARAGVRFRPRYGVRLNIATRAVASPAANRRLGQGHHIRHWARGGPTTLSNLTMLCRRHHRAVHEEGFHVERRSDGELCFRRPDGTLLVESPALPPVPIDPVRTICARNAADGIHIDAQTSKPGWLGEWLDVGYAIDVLHPAATGGRATATSPAAAPISSAPALISLASAARLRHRPSRCSP